MKKLLSILKSIKLQLIVGLLLLVTGLGLFWLRDYNSVTQAEPVTPPSHTTPWVAPKPSTIQGNPVSISLPSLGLSIPIINGYYNAHTGGWTLTTDSVQYATITPPPNNASGNTFLYGHYRTGVFATLHTIKPGSLVTVKTDNGHVFTYVFASSRVTDPNDDSVFNYQGPPILTIQTCTGLFFQYREFFTFNFVSVT